MSRRKDWRFQCSREFWHRFDVSLAEKAVVALLQTFANKEGCCWPTKRQLAEAGCISEGTLSRYLRTLKAKKIIGISSFRDKQGHERNYYMLNPSIVKHIPKDSENGANPS